MIKHDIRYLTGTSHSGLLFKRNPDSDGGLIGFVDSSHGNEMERKSVGGFVCFFNGMPMSYRSWKQRTVSKSSTVTEFKELSDAIDEGLLLKKLAIEMELVDEGNAFELRTDSDNAELIIKGTGYNPSLKTVDIVYYSARDYIKKGMPKLSLIDTRDNVADGMTKALGPVAFAKFVKGLRIVQNT